MFEMTCIHLILSCCLKISIFGTDQIDSYHIWTFATCHCNIIILQIYLFLDNTMSSDFREVFNVCFYTLLHLVG